MICTTCRAAHRKPHGSPLAHYCDACGFPLSATGESIRDPRAAFVVAAAANIEARVLKPTPLDLGEVLTEMVRIVERR